MKPSRLEFIRGIWVYNPPYTADFIGTVAGRKIGLVNRLGVKCHNPEVGRGFVWTVDYYNVPNTFCLKCPYKQNSDEHGINRYPWCKYDNRDGQADRGEAVRLERPDLD